MNGFIEYARELLAGCTALGIKLVSYECVGSTNAEAKVYAAHAADHTPALFVAREQSAGRGRLGRSFLSPAGGIYMTLLYFTHDALDCAVTVTTATAVAAANAIRRVSGEDVGIKWVNDIYNEQGKVAGILVESLPVNDGYAVAVGIGINVGECDFAPEIRDIASSLGELDATDRARLVLCLCGDVLKHAKDHANREYMSDYRKMFILQDKTVDVFVSGEPMLRGTVVGVDGDGGLMIQPEGENEIKTLSSGEITVRVV